MVHIGAGAVDLVDEKVVLLVVLVVKTAGAVDTVVVDEVFVKVLVLLAVASAFRVTLATIDISM